MRFKGEKAEDLGSEVASGSEYGSYPCGSRVAAQLVHPLQLLMLRMDLQRQVLTLETSG